MSTQVSGYCRICHLRLKAGDITYCPMCASDVHRREQEVAERLKKNNRPFKSSGFTAEQICRMAEKYYHYDSYGKMRAYVDEHGCWPPDTFLRTNYNAVDWQAGEFGVCEKKKRGRPRK